MGVGWSSATPDCCRKTDETEVQGLVGIEGQALHEQPSTPNFSVDLDEPDVTPGIEFDIPEDAYGAAILALVKDRGTIAEGKATQLTWMRFIFPLVLLAVNLTLQILLVTFIYSHVVQPAVSSVQEQYLHFHQEVFDENGNFLDAEWEDYPEKKELCQIALTNRAFLYSVLFIWSVRMVQELRTSQRFFTDVFQMPDCGHPSEMTQEVRRKEKEKSHCSVVALTRCTRWLLYLLVCLPKLLISLALLYLGCRFLSATANFENLVMNTVALEFVLTIDETLFHACVPVSYRTEVREVNFFVRMTAQEKNEQKSESKAFMRSFFYFGFSVFCVWVYSYLLQNVLPRDVSDLTEHCGRYMYSDEVQPFCTTLHNMESCYPFGESEVSPQ
jgi:hypothetical protein